MAHQEIDLKTRAPTVATPVSPMKSGRAFTRLLEAGFTDTFRYLYPDLTGAYSWWSYRFNARKNNAGWRIDYFLVSMTCENRCARLAFMETSSALTTAL